MMRGVHGMKMSVITVCLNSANTLERTIVSVLNQGIEELEYIIIDGNSTDGTKDIIKKYEKYISYWVSESDEGLFGAMNKGIEKATGDIVAIINSDDFYEKGALKRVIKYFHKNKIDILTGNEYIVGKNGKREAMFHYDSMDEIHKRIIFMHPAFFVKRVCYTKIGLFDTKYKFSADYDWMIRAYDAGFLILDVDDFFTSCSDGGIGSSNTLAATVEQKEIALQYTNDKEIELYYLDRINYVKFREIYKKLVEIYDCKFWDKLREKAYKILQIIEQEGDIYIWGIGINGVRIYELFKLMKINITGFVESQKSKDYFLNIPVVSPDEIKSGSSVFITPFEYKEEIENEIRNRKDVISYVGYEFFNRLVED